MRVGKFLNSKNGLLVFYFLFLLDRLNNFLKFSIIYTDSDQTVMWQITKDLSNGIFHGPSFYGQSYNPIIESIIAVPFYWISNSLPFSVPLATLILSTIPFLLLTRLFHKTYGPLLGIVPLVLGLLLSQEYLMLTSIPRGFVTGTFFGIFSLFFWYKASSKPFNKLAVLFSGILLGLAFYFNLNTVLLAPLFLFKIPNLSRSIRVKLGLFVLGFFIGATPIFLSAHYYAIHPELVIHPSPKFTLSINAFQNIISNLSSYFDFVTPIFWRAGWISLLLFFPLIYWFRKRNKLAAIVTLVTILIIFLSFFSVKVSDGTNSIFFAGARMYLAYPFIIIALTIELLNTVSDKLKYRSVKFLSVTAIISLIVKLTLFSSLTSHALRGSKNSVVEVMKVAELIETCKKQSEFAERPTTLILAIEGSSKQQITNYGCPCLFNDFQPTFMPSYERRTWLMNEYNHATFDTIAIYGFSTIPSNFKYDVIKSDSTINMILIDGKHTTIGEIRTEFLENQ